MKSLSLPLPSPYILGNCFSPKILTNLALHVMFYYKFLNLTTKGEALLQRSHFTPLISWWIHSFSSAMEAFMRNGAESKLVGTWEYLSTNSKWPSWGGQCVLGGGGGRRRRILKGWELDKVFKSMCGPKRN
jgi:hypothetical protein